MADLVMLDYQRWVLDLGFSTLESGCRRETDSPLEERVWSEPVSEMDLRDNARFRGVYRIVTRDENACFRVIGGIFKTGAAARSLGFGC